MAHEWPVTVRWVIVLMPSGRTWASADTRDADALRQQIQSVKKKIHDAHQTVAKRSPS